MKYILAVLIFILLCGCNKENNSNNNIIPSQPLLGTYKYVSLHVPACNGHKEVRFTYPTNSECTENDSGGIRHCRKGQLTINQNLRFVSTIQVNQGILNVFTFNGQGNVTISGSIATFCYDGGGCFDTQLSQGRIIATTKNTWGCDVNHYLSR